MYIGQSPFQLFTFLPSTWPFGFLPSAAIGCFLPPLPSHICRERFSDALAYAPDRRAFVRSRVACDLSCPPGPASQNPNLTRLFRSRPPAPLLSCPPASLPAPPPLFQLLQAEPAAPLPIPSQARPTSPFTYRETRLFSESSPSPTPPHLGPRPRNIPVGATLTACSPLHLLIYGLIPAPAARLLVVN